MSRRDSDDPADSLASPPLVADCSAATPHRLSDTLMWLLKHASARSQQVTHERLAAGGIRRWHYGVLAVLIEFGPAAQADISRRLGIDRSDLVAVLNDLEALTYVRREPDPTDRRRNSVVLTPNGKAAVARFDRVIRAADDEMLAPLSGSEQAQLRAMLEKLLFAPTDSNTP